MLEIMDSRLIITISLMLQLTAVFFAGRLILRSGNRVAAITILVGVSLMAVRRGIVFYRLIRGETMMTDVFAEIVALIISFLFVIGILYITRLIEEREKTQGELKHTLSLLKATLQSTADGILVVSKDDRITDFNERFVEMWDIPKTALDLHNDEEAFAAVRNRLQKPRQFLPNMTERGSDAVTTGFDILELKDGRVFEQYSQPQRIGDEPVGRVWSFRDITERKKAESGLKHSEEKLRSLYLNLQAMREDERANIAREIHDELGQVMTAIKMDIAWMSRTYADHEGISRKSQSTLNLVDRTIRSIKKICTELRPSILDHLGLEAAIRWQAQEFQDRTDIECTVAVKEDLEVSSDRSVALFRIFQESLTNVMRHANATRVAVSLQQNDGRIVLEVSDNGKGITEEDLSKSNSFGLLGMRERVYPWNGTVDICGAKNDGTTIVVTLSAEQDATAVKT